MAPEIIEKNKISEKCDIWSIGILLYVLLCGYYPFSGENNKILAENIRKGKFSFSAKIWDKISTDAKDLIEKMLTLSSFKRVSAMNAYNHKWFLLKDNFEFNGILLPLNYFSVFFIMEETLKSQWK